MRLSVNSTTYNSVRKINKLGFFVGMIFFGAIMLIAGAILFFASPSKSDFGTTEGTITQITYSSYNESHRVFVSYEVDGVLYENVELNTWSSDMYEGQKLNLRYDLKNPGNVQPESLYIITYILLGVGGGLVLLGVILIIVNVKKMKNAEKLSAPVDHFENNNNLSEFDESRYSGTTESKAPDYSAPDYSYGSDYRYKYYFRVTSGFKPSYYMEDESRRVVYSAKMTKLAVIGENQFDFTDVRTGYTAPHGITNTVSYGTGTGAVNFYSSSFKFDGQDIWDYFHQKGYNIEMGIDGLKMFYEVYRGSEKIAYLESFGLNLKEASREKIDGKSAIDVLKVECVESELPIVFIACLAAERLK